VPIAPPEVALQGFSTLLNADMQHDLPAYLATAVRPADSVPVHSAEAVVDFNMRDSLLYAPYGQARLLGVVNDRTPADSLERIKKALKDAGRRFFNAPWQANRLEAVLSVNNRHAGLAAVAEYPALAVPMGYRETGEPAGLTFIGKPFQEEKLLDLGHAFEELTRARQLPPDYGD
jgi:amidase